MKHKSFQQVTDLLAGHETYAQAYAEFLQTRDIPPSLEEDIFAYNSTRNKQMLMRYMYI